jgi:hypothetical protein
MKLLTKEILEKLPKLDSTEDVPAAEKLVIVKFFDPFTAATWYAVEYDPDQGMFFGYAFITEGEWGYFSLNELESIKRIERDLWFKPTKFKDIKR